MRRILRACLLALGSVLAWSAAQASTITFDFSDLVTTDNYTEGGFDFSGATAAPGGGLALRSWGLFPEDADTSDTSATLFGNLVGVVMKASNGKPFTLDTVDLADTFNAGVAPDILFDFFLHDGTEILSTVTLDSVPGLQTFTFGVTNVDYVTWINANPVGFQPQFDNVVAFASVAPTPIPATLPLFVSALGGIGLLGWRRRRAA